MEMKVDSKLIRSGREGRGWTQDHLARVAGLSLRTIQRIENTGFASLESVTALASVLQVEIADLRARASEPPPRRVIRLSLELPLRLALALASGVLVALHFRRGADTGWIPYNFEWSHYAIAGALFGGAVLCPYLASGRRFVLRALTLMAASALSYFLAMVVTLNLNSDEWLPGLPAPASYLLGSLVGVGIVLAAAKFLVPLRVKTAYWLLGLSAGLIGGAALHASFEVLDHTASVMMAGFGAWHVLVCLAIHLGHRPDEATSGILAAFCRTRGRFSIVPGWMRLSLSPAG